MTIPPRSKARNPGLPGFQLIALEVDKAPKMKAEPIDRFQRKSQIYNIIYFLIYYHYYKETKEKEGPRGARACLDHPKICAKESPPETLGDSKAASAIADLHQIPRLYILL